MSAPQRDDDSDDKKSSKSKKLKKISEKRVVSERPVDSIVIQNVINSGNDGKSSTSKEDDESVSKASIDKKSSVAAAVGKADKKDGKDDKSKNVFDAALRSKAPQFPTKKRSITPRYMRGLQQIASVPISATQLQSDLNLRESLSRLSIRLNELQSELQNNQSRSDDEAMDVGVPEPPVTYQTQGTDPHTFPRDVGTQFDVPAELQIADSGTDPMYNVGTQFDSGYNDGGEAEPMHDDVQASSSQQTRSRSSTGTTDSSSAPHRNSVQRRRPNLTVNPQPSTNIAPVDKRLNLSVAPGPSVNIRPRDKRANLSASSGQSVNIPPRPRPHLSVAVGDSVDIPPRNRPALSLGTTDTIIDIPAIASQRPLPALESRAAGTDDDLLAIEPPPPPPETRSTGTDVLPIEAADASTGSDLPISETGRELVPSFLGQPYSSRRALPPLLTTPLTIVARDFDSTFLGAPLHEQSQRALTDVIRNTSLAAATMGNSLVPALPPNRDAATQMSSTSEGIMDTTSTLNVESASLSITSSVRDVSLDIAKNVSSKVKAADEKLKRLKGAGREKKRNDKIHRKKQKDLDRDMTTASESSGDIQRRADQMRVLNLRKDGIMEEHRELIQKRQNLIHDITVDPPMKRTKISEIDDRMIRLEAEVQDIDRKILELSKTDRIISTKKDVLSVNKNLPDITSPSVIYTDIEPVELSPNPKPIVTLPDEPDEISTTSNKGDDADIFDDFMVRHFDKPPSATAITAVPSRNPIRQIEAAPLSTPTPTGVGGGDDSFDDYFDESDKSDGFETADEDTLPEPTPIPTVKPTPPGEDKQIEEELAQLNKKLTAQNRTMPTITAVSPSPPDDDDQDDDGPEAADPVQLKSEAKVMGDLVEDMADTIRRNTDTGISLTSDTTLLRERINSARELVNNALATSMASVESARPEPGSVLTPNEAADRLQTAVDAAEQGCTMITSLKETIDKSDAPSVAASDCEGTIKVIQETAETKLEEAPKEDESSPSSSNPLNEAIDSLKAALTNVSKSTSSTSSTDGVDTTSQAVELFNSTNQSLNELYGQIMVMKDVVDDTINQIQTSSDPSAAYTLMKTLYEQVAAVTNVIKDNLQGNIVLANESEGELVKKMTALTSDLLTKTKTYSQEKNAIRDGHDKIPGRSAITIDKANADLGGEYTPTPTAKFPSAARVSHKASPYPSKKPSTAAADVRKAERLRMNLQAQASPPPPSPPPTTASPIDEDDSDEGGSVMSEPPPRRSMPSVARRRRASEAGLPDEQIVEEWHRQLPKMAAERPTTVKRQVKSNINFHFPDGKVLKSNRKWLRPSTSEPDFYLRRRESTEARNRRFVEQFGPQANIDLLTRDVEHECKLMDWYSK